MQDVVSHSTRPERARAAGPSRPDDLARVADTRAGEPAPAAAKRTRPVPAFWKIWLPIPIFFILLDLTFNGYFWQIPKLTGPGADWGYQFLIDAHRLHRPKPPGAVRVVAFGSSVSGAFDPYQVASLLRREAPTPPVEVHRLMLPGIHPSDYRLFWQAEGPRAHPDVVVILFNLLDFLNSSSEHEMNPTLHAALPPWRTLAERHAALSVPEELEWALDGTSNLYRYRKVIRSSVQDHLKAAFHLLTARPLHGGYGVYADGYTKQRFGVPLNGASTLDFDYYVDPEWIRQRGEVVLTFAAGKAVVARTVETEPGWKTVHLVLPAAGARVLEVAADSAWNPRAGGLDDDVRLLGVRLRQPLPAGALNGQAPPYRYPPFDDGALHEFLRMGGATGAEFARKWHQVLGSNTAFGKRFRFYRDAKLRVRTEAFQPTGEYAEMARLVDGFRRLGAQVVLINTPESPWILNDYQDSGYYRDYLGFFRKLAQQPGVRFIDLRSALPPEDFNDWHHPSYIGGIKLGPTFAQLLREVVASLPAGRPAAEPGQAGGSADPRAGARP